MKNTLSGLFAGYDTDKYGVITNLETFNPQGDGTDDAYDEDDDRVQSILGVTGIDKVSREYTVILGTTSGENYTITCDEGRHLLLCG